MGPSLISSEQLDDLEARIHSHLQAGENTRAATLAIEDLGAEILGWLCGVFLDEHVAGEIYEAFKAELVRELWSCPWNYPFRTWAYGLARKTAYRQIRSPSRQDSLLGASLPPRVRSLQETRTWAKTQINQSAFTRLRERLSPEERMVLILRVDRQMTWEDIARVMEAPFTPETLRESASRLRQYFHRVRERLSRFALEEGLIRNE